MKWEKTKKILKIVGIYLGMLLLAVLIFLVGTVAIFEKGPSEQVRDLFVVTVQQSSAAKPLAHLFLSKETVSQIMEDNTTKEEDFISSGVDIEIDDKLDKNAIIIEDIEGPTYTGKLMIVNNPKRISVYCVKPEAGHGVTVLDTVKKTGAIAGINGGGFEDKAGTGSGNAALGIVVSNGEWIFGENSERVGLIGFDNDDKLVVGYMTAAQAKERGIRDAVSWAPPLIVDGQIVERKGDGALNPRTAIGQRADGAVLLLVVNGRRATSIGATYSDIAGILKNHGAVVAGNLDGGNSSIMVYNNEIINIPASVNGERYIPTVFLVK